MVIALLVGLACGFAGSIPIAGPTAVIVLERGLAGKNREAFAISVGAAIAETVYACCAFLGMTAALSTMPWLVPASRVLGAIILLGLGLYLALAVRPPPAAHEPEPPKVAHGGKVLLGMLITGVNPTLLATWSAVVTVLHSTGVLRVAPLDGFPFALGVGVGVVGWFGLLLALLHRFRKWLRPETLARLVRIMGWVLVVAAVALLVNLVRIWLQ